MASLDETPPALIPTPPRAQRVGYQEAAAFLGVKMGTLRSWVARGQVPHYRLGPRLVVFDVFDLGRWLDEHRVGGTAR